MRSWRSCRCCGTGARAIAGGSLTPLLMNMVRSRPLEAGELRELRELVRELGQRDRHKGEKP